MTTKDLRDTADDSHDVTIQWYTSTTAVVSLGTSLYSVLAASRAVCTKVHVTSYNADMTN